MSSYVYFHCFNKDKCERLYDELMKFQKFSSENKDTRQQPRCVCILWESRETATIPIKYTKIIYVGKNESKKARQICTEICLKNIST